MKTYLLLSLAYPLILCGYDSRVSERVLQDEILARVHTQAGKDIVTASDTKRRALDGTDQNLHDLIIDKLMIADARRMQITVPPSEAQRYLEMVQRQTGQSREQILQSFQAQGYSYTQAIECICQLQTQAQLYGMRINQNPRILVSKDDAYAIWKEATTIELRTAQVTVPSLGYATLDDVLEKSNILTTCAWSETFPVTVQELPPERAHAADATPGQIVFTERIEKNPETEIFEITQLVDKRPGMAEPFEDCFESIALKLQQERRLEITRDYYQQLCSGAIIRFTYPEHETEFYESIKNPTWGV